MIELLQIEPSFSAEAVRRQLAKLRAAHVAIALPDGYTELNNIAQLRLLQRQALIQRSHVALITFDAATSKAAQQLGIPVFGSSKDAQRREWKMEPETPFIDPRKPAAGLPDAPPWRRDEIVQREARPTLHRARQERIQREKAYQQALPGWLSWLGYASAAALILAVLASFVRFVLPAATVTLVPGRDQISITFPLTASPNLATADVENGLLPARLVETTVEGTGAISTTGTQEQATLRAGGQVVFSNLSTAPVAIPVGTILSTGTGQLVKFRTTSNTGVEGSVGARAFVNIEALEAGIESNVRAGTITNIDGPLRFRLRVTNPGGTFGGGVESKHTVTEQDLQTLTALVRADIEAGKDFQALQSRLQPGEWLAEESINTEILTEGFDHYKDEPADTLNLTLRMAASGSAVDEAALRDTLILRVQEALPERAQLIVNTMTIQRVPGAQAIADGIRFTVTVNADYLSPIDPNEVSQAIAGLNVADATAQLYAKWNLAAPPEFYQDPDIFGVLPALGSRIQVRVDYGNQ